MFPPGRTCNTRILCSHIAMTNQLMCMLLQVGVLRSRLFWLTIGRRIRWHTGSCLSTKLRGERGLVGYLGSGARCQGGDSPCRDQGSRPGGGWAGHLAVVCRDGSCRRRRDGKGIRHRVPWLTQSLRAGNCCRIRRMRTGCRRRILLRGPRSCCRTGCFLLTVSLRWSSGLPLPVSPELWRGRSFPNRHRGPGRPGRAGRNGISGRSAPATWGSGGAALRGRPGSSWCQAAVPGLSSCCPSAGMPTSIGPARLALRLMPRPAGAW